MRPTIEPADRVVVDLHAYHHGEPKRGDVVVIGEVRLDTFNSMAKLQRVIAIPGDTIAGQGGRVILDNIPIREAYIPGSASIDVSSSTDENLKKLYTYGPVTLGPGEYFLMGDDREFSDDSRTHGPVRIEAIQGKALYILSSDNDRDGKSLE